MYEQPGAGFGYGVGVPKASLGGYGGFGGQPFAGQLAYQTVAQPQASPQPPVPYNSAPSPRGSRGPMQTPPNQPRPALAQGGGQAPMSVPKPAPAEGLGAASSAAATASAVASPKSAGTPPLQPRVSAREQALERRVQQLEAMLQQKDQIIQELQAAVANAPAKACSKGQGMPPVAVKARSPGRTGGSSLRRGADCKPVIQYTAASPDDAIDTRLEEFYNTTDSAIQFRRINRGFYRFGESLVELDIINHKLMARTEDGWNRRKFGPIEKFMTDYEKIEREKLDMLPGA